MAETLRVIKTRLQAYATSSSKLYILLYLENWLKIQFFCFKEIILKFLLDLNVRSPPTHYTTYLEWKKESCYHNENIQLNM